MMEETKGLGSLLNVDLTLILDGSEEMTELPDRIRECVSGFIGQFNAGAEEHARHISRYRVKVIVFRQDEQGQPACEESPYFVFRHTVDEGMADLLAYLEAIRPHGGCSLLAAVEALKKAMALEYVPPIVGGKARHILLVLTRAHAACGAELLPVETTQELAVAWAHMDCRCKSMFIRTTAWVGWHILEAKLEEVWLQHVNATEMWDKEWRPLF